MAPTSIRPRSSSYRRTARGCKRLPSSDSPSCREGEEIAAFVVGADGLTEAALIAHCRVRLGTDKRPRKFVFVTDLPRNANGKISRAQLRQQLENRDLRRSHKPPGAGDAASLAARSMARRILTIGAAPADVAGHMRNDLIARGARDVREQLRRFHDLAGLAIAALWDLLGDPGTLQRMLAMLWRGLRSSSRCVPTRPRPR